VRFSSNDKPATYVLDSDADLSLLSEPEAKRLGFTVREVATSIDGMSGKGIKPRGSLCDHSNRGQHAAGTCGVLRVAGYASAIRRHA
jgi:hypothetical protein